MTHLEVAIVDSHLVVDAELNLQRVHANEIPRVEERLVFFRWSHEPVVRILLDQCERIMVVIIISTSIIIIIIIINIVSIIVIIIIIIIIIIVGKRSTREGAP